MSSGSYFPQAVKRVNIAKSDGGTRPLGVPTVADRIAQMVVKMEIEKELERHFHPDSYGYRPNKSAHQALAQVRQRCWQYPWVLDMDIKGFFDAIDHERLLKAVDKHVHVKWHRLYIRRWLTVPVQHPDGRIEQRTRGTPQGGVISPVLANLFLHYVFDVWVKQHCRGCLFVRYADDIICHCKTQQQVVQLHQQLSQRFTECELMLHPVKTKIVYCKSWKYRADYEHTSFNFLSYTFRPRLIRCRNGKFLVGFIPCISNEAAKSIRADINAWKWRAWSRCNIGVIFKFSLSKLRGWRAYFGKFGSYSIDRVLFHFEQKLTRWAKRKYKTLKTYAQAARRVAALRYRYPSWFALG